MPENKSKNVIVSANGITIFKRAMARCWFFELAAPGDLVAGRDRDFGGDLLLCLTDERAEIAAAHVHAHADSSADHFRA